MEKKLHKLVERQVRKYLPTNANNDELDAFIHAISESYFAYERDKELDSHAFAISEKEYHQINTQLKTEVNAKKVSINKLKETLSHIDEYKELDFSDDNLVGIVDYLRLQIRKRKIVETELNKNITRISSLISNLQSGVLVENEERQIVFTNDTFCKLFHIPVKPTQLIGQDCTMSAEQTKHLFKDPASFVARINVILEDRKQVLSDILELADGRTFERDFIPVYVDNDYRGHLWNYTDITEKKKILDAVAESEKKNRLIMNSALDAIITIDDHGGIISWNPKAESLFGWKEEEVIGKKLVETIIPEQYLNDKEFGLSTFSDTCDSPYFKKLLELNVLNKDKTEFPVELSITPINFENHTFYCAFIRDISERKKAESVLAASEEKYRTIIANINLGLLEVDLNDRIQMANQSFCRMSGYELDEIINQEATKLFVIGENEEVIIEKQSLRQDGFSDAYEIAVVNKRGEIKWWLISGAPRYNDKGELIGSVGIHLDITEHKTLERDLVEARELAEHSSKAKENFLANMSHEIRTPMNAIIGLTQQLEKSKLNPQQKLYIETISKATENLLIIVNDILDVTKIEAGKLNIENIEFDIRDLLKRSTSIFTHKIEEKGLSLSYQVDENIKAYHYGDPFRINQILTNLINNSIKFTSEGGVKVEVSLIEEFDQIQKIKFSVVDTGKGMSSEFVNNIFQKFTQENSSIARTYGGVGLGMSIVKELTNLMKGEILVSSELNKGTRIDLVFPLEICLNSTKEETIKPEIDLNNFKGIKVLVVEDNEMNRMLANLILQDAKMIVEDAINGEDAILKLKNKTYDIVLMDMQMPIMGGIEATIEIRKNINKEIPIIALTANAIHGEKEKCMDSGMNDYLSKPFKREELYEIIAKWTLEDASKNNTKKQKQSSLYNLEIIKNISNNNPEFTEKMIRIFKEQAEIFIVELNEAIKQDDRDKIRFIAHKIKPSIGNMGIHLLKDPILKLELESANLSQGELLILAKYCQNILKQVLEML